MGCRPPLFATHATPIETYCRGSATRAPARVLYCMHWTGLFEWAEEGVGGGVVGGARGTATTRLFSPVVDACPVPPCREARPSASSRAVPRLLIQDTPTPNPVCFLLSLSILYASTHVGTAARRCPAGAAAGGGAAHNASRESPLPRAVVGEARRRCQSESSQTCIGRVRDTLTDTYPSRCCLCTWWRGHSSGGWDPFPDPAASQSNQASSPHGYSTSHTRHGSAVAPQQPALHPTFPGRRGRHQRTAAARATAARRARKRDWREEGGAVLWRVGPIDRKREKKGVGGGRGRR